MQKNKNRVLFGSMKIMMAVALLAGVSIVCGKVLAIPGGDVMRFSFENLPILLAGMAFGPVVGCVTGVVADLLGCLMVGYTINPLVTAGAAAIGLISGILFWILKKSPCLVRVGVTVLTAHLVGSVVVKTFGLAKFYSFSFLTLMAWRGLNYLIVGALEFILLFVLFRNKAFTDQLNKLKR